MYRLLNDTLFLFNYNLNRYMKTNYKETILNLGKYN